MTTEDPEDGDDVLARLRAARPDRDAPDLADRACMARLQRLKGPAPEVVAGGYVIERCVGEGAYGTVYRARHPRVEKLVALKHLRRDVAQQMGSAARSLREANSLGKLNHPNVVQVFDVVEDGDETYIAMEYVDGESLVRWQQEPRAWQEVLSVYLQAGDGLAAAHAAGLLHLDLKPANVLVGRDGRVRVVDFGLARQVAGPTSVGDDKASETLVEHVPARGTIPYSSPEQRIGDDVDGRSDQYSLCVALYEALFGVLPFTANELAEMRYVAFDRPLRGARGRIPRRIDATLRRGVSRESHARWPSMALLLAALRRPAWFQRPFTWAFAGATLVAVPAALLYPSGPPACDDPREQLEGAWDDTRRAAISEAFAASHAPYADELAMSTIASLDSYAASWLQEMDSACATKPSISGDANAGARTQCLRRARDRLARVSVMIADGVPDVLERADDLVHELAPPHQCLVGGDTHPAVNPTSTHEALVDVDHATLWLATGELQEAHDAAERAVSRADEIGEAGARAEARLIRGRVRDAVGDTSHALEDLREAAALAIEAQRDDLAADAWRLTAKTATVRLRDSAQAGDTLRLAEAAVERLGRPARAYADLLDVRGEYQSLLGDDEAAEQSHRAALLRLEEVLSVDDPRWTETWFRLAGVRSRLGDLAEAEALDRRTLEFRERRLGSSHPAVAEALRGLAIVLSLQDETASALDSVDRAIAVFELNYGGTSASLASPLTLRAQLLLGQGKLDEAEVAARRAWSLQVAHLPITHIERKEGALVLLIQIAQLRGDLVEQLSLLRTARQAASARNDDMEIAILDENIAWTLGQSGKYSEAEAIYASLRKHPSADPLLLAHAAAGLGEIELARGRPTHAVEHLDTALHEIARLDGEHEAKLAEVRYQLAQVLALTGGPASRVVELATAARRYYAAQALPDELAHLDRLIANATNQGTKE